MQKEKNDIIIFLIATTTVILILASIAIILIYLYQKKQLVFRQRLETLKLDHEKNLLSAQLEIQEDTFQHISREIHDNISLSLTLAKLYLNTLNLKDEENTKMLVHSSVDLISRSIDELSNLSRSLNAELISNQGLIEALEKEIKKIQVATVFSINMKITGEPVFLPSEKELVIFRIIQECFNNIIRHAHAKSVDLVMHFNTGHLDITIQDDGRGFQYPLPPDLPHQGTGINNIKTRIGVLDGKADIASYPGHGTRIHFIIPF